MSEHSGVTGKTPMAGLCTVLPRCGDSGTEREFPPHQVYGADDRGIVGVESFVLEFTTSSRRRFQRLENRI
jgi:hypothetical protein